MVCEPSERSQVRTLRFEAITSGVVTRIDPGWLPINLLGVGRALVPCQDLGGHFGDGAIF